MIIHTVINGKKQVSPRLGVSRKYSKVTDGTPASTSEKASFDPVVTFLVYHRSFTTCKPFPKRIAPLKRRQTLAKI